MKHISLLLALLVMSTIARVGLGNESDNSRHATSQSIFPLPKRAATHAHEKCPETKKRCETCHKTVSASKWSSDRLIPAMAVCVECHPAAKDATPLTIPTEDCRACHQSIAPNNMPVRNDYRRPNLRFSHKAHTKTKCGSCHPKAQAQKDPGASLDVIGMKECFRCHSSSPCRKCHITDKDGRMITDFGKGKIIPPSWLVGKTHGMEWSGTHASLAGRDSDFCAACHHETFCSDCHSGARRPRKVHPGDWLTSHGVSTRLDNPRCKGCHREQSFCLTCHRRSGVAPDSPTKSKPPQGIGRYHKGMETRTLMRRAKQDIVSCVSCHSESSCVTCHIRINPHPPDFARRCKPLVVRNQNACVKCHTNDVARFCK
jgi:hypothetical protein